jgi:threonine 3-dehydrogenase
MKAIIKSKREPGLWLGEVARPEPGPTDVLIRIQHAAICGTDVHIYNWDKWAQQTIPVPVVVGHEYVGIVEDVGNEVTAVAVGDRVSGEGHIVCGVCRNCRAGRRHLCRNTQGVGVNRAGAFAEYLVIPAQNAYQIPAAISDEIASILDPLGNAVHTALSFDLVGEDVLITGAGPIGLMAAAVARHAGARHIVITDVKQDRLKLAENMGASRGVNANEFDAPRVMADLGMREGFDVGLEMSGSAAALSHMVECMNNGGNVALLGLFPEPVSIDLSKAILKGITFKGIYGRKMYDTWHKMIAMLGSGLEVGAVITHHLPFESFEQGFAELNEGKACKVVLDLAT